MTYSDNLEKLRQAGVIDMNLSFGCEVEFYTTGLRLQKASKFYGRIVSEKYRIQDGKRIEEYIVSNIGFQQKYHGWKSENKTDEWTMYLNDKGDLVGIEIYDKANILGHPLTIGRVLWWIDDNSVDNMFMNYYIEDLYMMVMDKRKHKDLTLDDQPNKEEIAEFLVSLVK